MVRENDFIAVFHSIHRVMKAEKILKKEQIDIMLIPAPRQISSDCGLALRYAPSEKERLDDTLSRHDLVPTHIYQFRDNRFVPITSKSAR